MASVPAGGISRIGCAMLFLPLNFFALLKITYFESVGIGSIFEAL
jgi:hypothetical protein